MAHCMVYPGDHVHLERMNSPLFWGESSRVTKIKLNEKAVLISKSSLIFWFPCFFDYTERITASNSNYGSVCLPCQSNQFLLYKF